MKDITKRTLKILFGSLIKNDSAIEGAKTAPWWIAVILFIIGNFLPIIPIMVNASKTYGASFVSGFVYGYDQALMSATTQLKTDKYELKVEDHQLLAYKDSVKIENAWELNEEQISKDLTPIASYVSNNNGLETHVLDIYYTDRPVSKGAYTISKMIKDIEKVYYGVGTNEKYNKDVHSDYYIPSYLLFYKEGVFSKIFKTGNKAAAAATYSGLDWKHTENMELLTATLEVKDVAANPFDINYTKGVLNNWKGIFNDCYKSQKVVTFWSSSGIYYGIYLALGIFMGLMMFLLTRGKRNPNRNLNFWITTKIAAWICFTPAVLAMIVGFVWSAAAGIGFIVLMGLRTMWLSMRQLSPAMQQ